MTENPNHVRVKICGLTRREDAILAAKLGADHIGLIFVPNTPRFVTLEEAAKVLDFSPRPPAIGVFRNSPRAEMLRTAERVGLDGFQLHGKETPEECRGLPGFTIKVIGVRDETSLDGVDKFETDAILCDTQIGNRSGGTGKAFDHSLVVDLAKRRRVILAGGLNPDNVVEAVQAVHPWGVDVSSGVEAMPRIKDPQRLENFFANLRRAGLK